ncbi:unnamed protein product [Onchocerca ochengi]|uniref:CCDC66 domain-containing protein n=1 Tax=Onchocerca ochengi TaxID=42157 RepID=A0A182E879_ONCOC|nr:unnamed protein product [Onchocerca ochengi]
MLRLKWSLEMDPANTCSSLSFKYAVQLTYWWPNYKNGQITNISTAIPKDGTKNDIASTSSEVLSTGSGSSHIQCPVHLLQSQTASLWQSHHQFFPVYYPVAADFPTNLHHWRPHLFSSQIIAPIMLEQRPTDLRHLRPIQIGNKIYYEPVSSSSALYSSPTSIEPQSVTSASLLAIPNNARFQNVNLPRLPNTTIPVPTDNISGQSKLLHSKAAGINHSTTSRYDAFSNNGSVNLPWTFGIPQPKSGIRGTSSWQTPLLVTREDLIFNTEVNETSTVSTFQNPQCQTSPSHKLHGSLCRHSLPHKIIPSSQQQYCRKVTAIDSTEQYMRDLQLQIEENRRRKEEERQRELEMEKKEIIKFEEYRRKIQQEIEEEERKEKEKILAAQHRATRMRALQEEAALKARREAKNRMRRNVCCNSENTRTMEGRKSSIVEPNRLEWWEKKKEHLNASRSAYSPVIPTLRKKNEISANPSRNTAFEILESNASVPSCAPSDWSKKSHSSSRLRRRCYHSSLTAGRNNSLDSAEPHQKSSHSEEKQQNESLLSSLR